MKKELLKAYVLSSVLSCLAALIMCARYNQAKADNGNSYLMQTIVAAVIGGCSIDGGSGNLIGVVIAVAIIQILTNGLTVRGLDQSLIKVISALLLIITILVKRRFSFERKQDAKAKA